MLPGQAVMEGHYSGYASHVEVSIGPWKWVRLDPASLPDDGLAGATLREPRDLHELIEKHSQYDPPLPLAAVVAEPLMTLTKQQVREVLDVYIRAWTEQDPELITTIFTPGAAYHERVLGAPILGRDGIRDDWQTKVVGSQGNIKCELLNLYLDGETAIVEWEAEFDDRSQHVRKRMREVALLVFDGHRIKSLREYWASEVVELAPVEAEDHG